MFAVQVYLGRFERIVADHTIFTGVTYTDAHVMVPGTMFVAAALAVGALIAMINAIAAPKLRWLIASVVPAAACYVVVGVFGWYVNSFIVKPNELVRERPFIAHNIEQTRTAYALNRVEQQPFPAETSVEAADAPQQPGDAPEHPPVGLARAAGHAAADSGNPHVLRFPRHRHRPLRDRRHGAADDARHARAERRAPARRAAGTGSTKS